MRIVVLDGATVNLGDNPWTELEKLAEVVVWDRTPDELIWERARDADILLTNKTPLTAETLGRLPQLKFVGVLATGVNVVEVAAARARGIPVSNVPAYSTESVAQVVFALLLEVCHRVGEHSRRVRAGAWVRSEDFCFWDSPQTELAGQKMGVVGFGRIGRRVGELAHAFGMEVLAYSPRRREPAGYEPFCWRGMEELFAEADVVSLHCPLTAENRGMVDAKLLGRMKRGAILINTARGLLINEADLAEALNSGRLAAAGVDVVSEEPMRADNPLLRARNCMITPHFAWATLAARRRLMATTVGNVAAFLAGKPVNVVNG